jgi:hypothetical protein
MRRLVLGMALGVVLFLGAGLVNNPFTGPPACPTCAVLTHAYGNCNEAVQGGYICP